MSLIAPLSAVVLLFDFPLGLLYGLKAELRYLSHANSNSSIETVSVAYNTDTLSLACAGNNGPEHLLPPRSADIPQRHVCPAIFVGPLLSLARPDYSSSATVYMDGEFIRPSPRSYDPLGPPSRYL